MAASSRSADRDPAAGKPGIPGGGQAAVRGQDGRGLRRHRRAWAVSRRSPMPRTATGTSPPITCRPSMTGNRCWWSARRTPKRKDITAAIRSPAARRRAARGQRTTSSPGWCRSIRSEAERGQATTYRPGDVHPVPPERQGRLYQGRAADRHRSGGGAARAKPAKFSLYRPETIALAEGDRIRFTGTVKTLDGEHTLKNGMAHTVAGFTARRHPAR